MLHTPSNKLSHVYHTTHRNQSLIFNLILGVYQLLIWAAVNIARELAAIPTDEDKTAPLLESDLLRIIRTWCCGITR